MFLNDFRAGTLDSMFVAFESLINSVFLIFLTTSCLWARPLKSLIALRLVVFKFPCDSSSATTWVIFSKLWLPLNE